MSKAITIAIKNNTTIVQPVQLGITPNVFSGINATTQYRWDVTSQSFSNLLNVLITYTYNGVSTTLIAPIIDQSLNGVITALNSLNVGVFWARTISGSTYIQTYNDFVVYENLVINPAFDIEMSTTVSAGNTLFFNLSMTSPNHIDWDWGDGTVDTFDVNNPNPSHTYTVGGTYSILVTFTSPASLLGFSAFSGFVTSISIANPNLTGLTTMSMANTSIISFNATNLSASSLLSTLNISVTQLASFDPSPLTMGLSALYLNDNQLTTINPGSFNNVGAISLDNNFITSFDISQLIMPTGGQFTISNNGLTTLVNPSGISANMINFTAQTNSIPTSQINDILIALDTAGLTNGTLLINNQTPAAPPSGVGITAKNNLIGKGWAVLTD